jgi:hypothetical protein
MAAASLVSLMKWVGREEWRDAFADLLERHVAQACHGADVELKDLPSLVGDQEFAMVWGCAFEDFLSRDLDGGRNIVDDYLKRRGWKESPSDRAYMAALRSSVISLYEISGIVPGESFLARDLVRGGEAVRVSERSATKSLRQWDRIAARVIDVRGKRVMSGGVLSFDHRLSEEMLARLSRAQKTARKESIKLMKSVGHTVDKAKFKELINADTVLRASAFLFTNVWLRELLDQVMHPSLPHFSNTDGEPLEFQKVHYPLLPGTTPEAVRMALAAIPAISEENDHFWNWLDGKPRKGRTPNKAAKGLSLISTMEDGRTILGNLELEEKRLTLSANSRARAERGRVFLDRALAGLVRAPLVETQTVEQMMTSRGKSQPKASSGLPPADERAFIHKTLDHHYGKMLGEPIPALGNTSPMKAVKTAEGREKVIAWLKTIENHSAKMPDDDPMASYDFNWLWEKLGLADHRR